MARSSRLLIGSPRRQADQRGSHKSVKELIAAIEEFISRQNEDPKPLCCTKSAHDILASPELPLKALTYSVGSFKGRYDLLKKASEYAARKNRNSLLTTQKLLS